VTTGSPLSGLTVAVTRPPTKGDRLAADLEKLGARVIDAPALRLVPPADPQPLAGAAGRVADFDWVVLTSAAGVQALSDATRARGGGAPRRLAVVGSQTAVAAAAVGWHAELVPERFDAEGLLERIDRAGESLEGLSVLLAVAENARDVLADGLAARGARVERVAAYGSVATSAAELGELDAAIRAGRVELLTFTSSGAARNLVEVLGASVLAVPVAAVGPVTARTARELGYPVVAVAEEHTMDGLIQSVIGWWASA
jgi:uroporphyrinogen III methyltransferase/synthase